MKKSKKTRISGGELTFYIISGLISLGGVALAVIGVIANALFDTSNALRTSESALIKAIKLNYSQLGGLVILLGAIIAVIVLVVVGKKVDVYEERQARRAQRLSFEKTSEEINEVK